MNRCLLIIATGMLLAGCGPLAAPLGQYFAGRVANPAVREASGLDCDPSSGEYWVLNDGGSPPELFRIAADGSDLGSVTIAGAGNIDWEDIAIVQTPGGRRAIIADIGDNAAAREHVVLHVVDLDDADNGRVRVGHSVRFNYPDGPRDAESIAVDATEGSAYVLTKRTIPAELYAVSIDADADDGVRTAKLLGHLESLPQPDGLDIRLARVRLSWHWQPTAMDFAEDGRLAAVLTYAGVYLYERGADQSWAEAFQSAPRRFGLDGVQQAESLCLADGHVVVTVEGTEAPIYRIPLDDPRWQPLAPANSKQSGD